MSFRHGRRVSAGLVVAIASAVAAVAVASGGQGVRAVAAKPRPDLVVRTVSASPSFVRPGAVMTIKDRVANSGNARAGRSTVGYYLTRNVPAPQIRIGGRQVGALRKHKSSSATTSARLPPTLGSASYRFMACADDSGKVRERHEANNCRAAPAPVVVDVLSPASSASAPHLTRSDSIPVAYTANGTGSPLARVELWVRTPGSGSFAKAATDTSPAASGHHFNYAASGDGQYSFYTRAYDRAGNAERAPSPPDAETLRDTRAPATADDVPTSFVDHAVTVTLTAADTGGAGVDKTYYETGGSPPDPTTSSSVYDPASKPALTNGERIKYLSTDNAGNAEPVKTSQPARIDTAAPTSSATATDLTNSSSISVGYSASDSGSGLAKVELYARPPGAGQFSLAGTDTSPAASGPSFMHTASSGDG